MQKIINKIQPTVAGSIIVCIFVKQISNVAGGKPKAVIATIKDIKDTDAIVTESIKAKRGNGTYSDRMEAILLTYDNISMKDADCVIRLQNGSYQSIWKYI